MKYIIFIFIADMKNKGDAQIAKGLLWRIIKEPLAVCPRLGLVTSDYQ